MLGSCGFSPTVAHWRRFVRWAADFISAERDPTVNGLRASDGYRWLQSEGRCPGTNCVWTMLHIRRVPILTHPRRCLIGFLRFEHCAETAIKHFEAWCRHLVWLVMPLSSEYVHTCMKSTLLTSGLVLNEIYLCFKFLKL